MQKSLTPKRVSDSFTEQFEIVMSDHLNGMGRLFGGQLAAWIDQVAGVVARRHANCNITTAGIDHLNFRQPVKVNELLVLRGKITYVGRTSMEVRVDSFVEDLSGVRRLVNTAFLTEVALDEEGRPAPVPPLIRETFQEEAEFEAGARRREMRKRMREEMLPI